jgi:hypothetical protein
MRKSKNIKYIIAGTLALILSLYIIPLPNAQASLDEADKYREQGLYEEAIEEYKKYEDFYNYYLLKNINNSNLYLEYSRLLADVLLRIAETYYEWGKKDNMVIYCKKVIFLSDKIGKDEVIDPIRKRAEELLGGKTPITPQQVEDEEDDVDYEYEDIAELTEDEYIQLELEDRYSLLDDSPLTDEELDETLEDINNTFDELPEVESTEEETITEEEITGGEGELELMEEEEEITLNTVQNFNPFDGPVSSQLMVKEKDGRNYIVVHLTEFDVVLPQKLGKPNFVSITDGNKTINSDNTDIDINSLNTEETRIYITINLTKYYTAGDLSKLTDSVIQFLLSIPPGFHTYLTYFNENDGRIINAELNTDNIYEIMDIIKPNSKISTNALLESTFEFIETHDTSIEKQPRFIISIHDEDSINISLSNRANELSVPINMFTLNESLTPMTEMSMKRITTNTSGVFLNGGLDEKINDFFYLIALYMVQSSFLISWPIEAMPADRNLKIIVEFTYDEKTYSILFDTSLIP